MSILIVLGILMALFKPGWGAGMVFSLLTYMIFTEAYLAPHSVQHYLLVLMILCAIPVAVFTCGKLLEFYEPLRKGNHIVSTISFGLMWLILLNESQIFDYLCLGDQLIQAGDLFTMVMLFTEIMSKGIVSGCVLALCLLLPVVMVEGLLVSLNKVVSANLDLPFESIRTIVLLLTLSLCWNSIVGFLSAELSPFVLVKLLH